MESLEPIYRIRRRMVGEEQEQQFNTRSSSSRRFKFEFRVTVQILSSEQFIPVVTSVAEISCEDFFVEGPQLFLRKHLFSLYLHSQEHKELTRLIECAAADVKKIFEHLRSESSNYHSSVIPLAIHIVFKRADLDPSNPLQQLARVNRPCRSMTEEEKQKFIKSLQRISVCIMAVH